MPSGFEAVWGSNFQVMYDTVQMFDFADGTSAADIDITRAEGWSLKNCLKIEIRVLLLLFFILSLSGKEIKYIFILIPPIMIQATEDWPKVSAQTRNKNRTGFHLRKRLDEGRQLPTGGQDGTDYIVFRLGEIYLNMAEAAFHLGKTGEALMLLI